MSGARSPGSNVVPMPAQAAMPSPMMWGGGGGYPAGCCPPGGMDALLQCYCDIQAATAFISKVVQDLAANDPAFQQSLAEAIAASGTNVPLIGVTNGSDAQPGQVGEWLQWIRELNVPSGSNTQIVSTLILQPGDWNVQAAAYTVTSPVTQVWANLSPVPPGLSDQMLLYFQTATASDISIMCPVERASVTVPTLLAFQIQTVAPAAANIWFEVTARRAR